MEGGVSESVEGEISESVKVRGGSMRRCGGRG